MSDSQLRSFNDSENRNWVVRVNVLVAERVKTADDINFDLLDLASKDQLERLLSDYGLLVGVLYEVLKPKIEERGLTPEQFAEGFAGDTLSEATDALLQAVADFFPNARQRENLRKLWETAKRATELGHERISAIIDEEIQPEKIEAMVKKEIAKAQESFAGRRSAGAQQSSA